MLRYGNSLVEPIEFLSFILVSVSFFTVFFSATIQQKWWRWARWAIAVPVGFILFGLTQSQGSGFISYGGVTQFVVLWGAVFAAATFTYTLMQRFWFKVGINKRQLK